MGKNIAAVLLLLLLSSSLFLILEARPHGTAAAKQIMVTVRIKGGRGMSGGGRSGGRSGGKAVRPVGGSSRGGGGNDGLSKGSSGRLLPRPGRAIPLIPAQTVPRASTGAKNESNAANAVYNSSLVFFLLITALWVLCIEI